MHRANIRLSSHGESDNTHIIDKILAERQQMAKMLGFQNYAELSLSQKMAETPQQVQQLLSDLRDRCYAKAVKEVEELDALGCVFHDLHDGIQPYDFMYLSEVSRESWYGISSSALRSYFPFERVLDGLFELCGQLFNIEIQVIELSPAFLS